MNSKLNIEKNSQTGIWRDFPEEKILFMELKIHNKEKYNSKKRKRIENKLRFEKEF